MTQHSPGPACGNNPNHALTDGDRQAVADFKAYLADRAALERVRAVLETEAVVGRSALEYRGLIVSALMAAETQPEAVALDLTDGPTRCPLCVDTVNLHTPNGARAHFAAVHPERRVTGRGPGPWPLLVSDQADEGQPPTPKPVATPANRRALVHNAITGALSAAGDWVPLSIRTAATRAALAEVDAWHANDPAPIDEAQGGATS